MLNRTFIAALVSGIVGLAGPVVAKDNGGGAGAEGAKVATNRVVVTHDVVASRPVVASVAAGKPSWDFAKLSSGGIGGSIGGYYINGTTRADNRPLPGGRWPYR
ncbi:MAG TPA: hypothetical protein VEU96_20595 [Bryobacteraceae bacterium]|nr:hypothetical protein [Bryobacteraceae bacterium]